MWGEKYPIVIKSWRTKWEHLSAYFKYPKDIRRIIYTTDVIDKRYFQRCVDYYSSWGAKATFFGERDCFS